MGQHWAGSFTQNSGTATALNADSRFRITGRIEGRAVQQTVRARTTCQPDVGATFLELSLMSNSSSFPASACSSGKLPVASCVAPEFHPKRKTIAVLVDFIDQTTDGYESALRAGFDAQCRTRDLNLLIIVGRALDDQQSISTHHNAVYRLLIPDCVDGVILLSSGLTCQVGPAKYARWCESLGSLPMCSIGMAVPGLPSIVPDNRAGMSAVVEHIVNRHQRKRIAYLDCNGNPDAAERLEACRGVLAKQGLSLDPRMIIHGAFEMSFAEQATLALIDEGAIFDAVIAANDGMAVGALRALATRGLRVPQDVLISGFDDIPITRFTEPTITTVRQPLERMAMLAVDAVADQFEGFSVKEQILVPAQLVVRGSCGCTHKVPLFPAPGPAKGKSATLLWSEVFDAESVAQRLTEALNAELGGQKGALLLVIQVLLAELNPLENPYNTLLPILIGLRLQSKVSWPPELEDAWYSAQRAISNVQASYQFEQRIQSESMYVGLLRTLGSIVALPDMASLKRALEEILPTIHQKDLILGLLPQEEIKQVELLVKLEHGQSVPLPEATFEVSEVFAETRRRTLLVLPIATESQMIGIIALEAQDAFFNYQLLRDHISAAFKVVALQEAAVRQTTLHERSAQERLATAERMRSLSVLAGGVAHDLNNALGSLVALSDVVLEELEERRLNPQHDETELRADLVSIKLGALRAAETIKDLMTLGRRSQVLREPVDLNQAVNSSVRDVRAQLPTERLRNAQLRVETLMTPLPMLASEPHVIRAIGNLLRNAIEAAGQDGVVAVTTELVRLHEPLTVYEVIPAGEYAVISVADTGPGIAAEQLNKVFEPFFSTKKLSEVSGSGLGLAIVHSVVKEHGGFLDVTSRVGQGSKFALYFPLIEGLTNAREEPTLVRRGRANVLVVDDDPLQLRVAHRVLSRLGYDVTTVASGVQAYRIVCEELRSSASVGGSAKPLVSAFDVLLMDMALNEDQTGFEVFQSIRQVFPAQKGIIVSGHSVMSGSGSIPTSDLLWLAKPYTATCLAQAVQSLLSP